MNPRRIKLHEKGERERMKKLDVSLWLAGHYTMNAVAVAVEHVMCGDKAKGEYVKEPILSKEIKKELTEEEIKRQREMFIAKLQVMKANYDSAHRGE